MKLYTELTYLGQIRRLRGLAQKALIDFGLPDANLTFIARSENTTFRIDATGQVAAKTKNPLFVENRYVLRVHRPGHQTPASLRSEMEWLSALHADLGLAVPAPIPTQSGAWLAEVAAPGVPGPRHCSLLRWVRGRLPRQQFRLSHFRALGRLMGQLHSHAAQWQPSPEFTRRHWDWDGLFGDHAGFKLPGREVWDLLPKPHYEPFWMVADQVKQVMLAWGRGAEAFGLIHADLSIGEEENVLIHSGEARAIDFDDCGYGYWVHDFATTLAHWQMAKSWPSIRKAVFDGYAAVRPLPEDQLAYLDLFMAGRHVSEILWAVDLAQIHPEFREELDEWTAHAARHVNLYIERYEL
jgi:Ser/Thr protein kinase RdoA (MazF antagonist)